MLGIGSSLVGRLLLYNALDMSFEYVKLKRTRRAKSAVPHPKITALVDYFEFCGVPGLDHLEGSTDAEWNITALQLGERLKRGDKIHLVDVREPHELVISHIDGAQNMPTWAAGGTSGGFGLSTGDRALL